MVGMLTYRDMSAASLLKNEPFQNCMCAWRAKGLSCGRGLRTGRQMNCRENAS